MYIKFIKDWPNIVGPSYNDKDGSRFYPKGYEGHVDNADAQGAIANKYAVVADEKKKVKAGAKKVETAEKAPKKETR